MKNKIKENILEINKLLDQGDRAPKTKIRPLLAQLIFQIDSELERPSHLERRIDKILEHFDKFKRMIDGEKLEYSIDQLLADIDIERRIYEDSMDN